MENLYNYDLLDDKTFKKFMCSKEARKIVARFLSAITGLSRELFLNALFVTDNINEEFDKYDVVIKVVDDNCFICEIKTGEKYAVFKNNCNDIKYVDVIKRILVSIDDVNQFNTNKPIMCFKSRDQYGHIEHDLYSSYYLVLSNLDYNKCNVDSEILRFMKMLITDSYEEMYDYLLDDEDYLRALGKLRFIMDET